MNRKSLWVDCNLPQLLWTGSVITIFENDSEVLKFFPETSKFEAVQSTWAASFCTGSLRGGTELIVSLYFTSFSFTDNRDKSCIFIAHETTLCSLHIPENLKHPAIFLSNYFFPFIWFLLVSHLCLTSNHGLWHSAIISALVPTPSLRKRLQYEYICLWNFAHA